jgi:hypothetical protein
VGHHKSIKLNAMFAQGVQRDVAVKAECEKGDEARRQGDGWEEASCGSKRSTHMERV